MGLNLFNNNWRDYVKRGERVMIQADVMPAIGAVTALKALLGVLVILGVLYFGLLLDNTPMLMFYIFIVPFGLLCGVCWSVVRFLRMLALKYVLTDTGIYKISGILSKRVKYIAYKKIVDVQISRGVVERIVGGASVGVSTASGGDFANGRQLSELTILGVTQYKKISEFIFKKIK